MKKYLAGFVVGVMTLPLVAIIAAALGMFPVATYDSALPFEKGFAEFADLLRRVASVPKEQLDAKIAADRAEKKNRCKKTSYP